MICRQIALRRSWQFFGSVRKALPLEGSNQVGNEQGKHITIVGTKRACGTHCAGRHEARKNDANSGAHRNAQLAQALVEVTTASAQSLELTTEILCTDTWRHRH